eukprot:CAMPEP_0116050188 /NCGR_PEP_ID=MMETSP0322-20121206/229_1 /TAXON_ID=163516 /ORGANISM="Leptocylindrus danicus var. apora, Strain B651" /LENGTH=627 /DNA_ID=CAMNT_0003532685 /DNA_START=420 /DNA_END=2303 /DNA_ORIENTATION=-
MSFSFISTCEAEDGMIGAAVDNDDDDGASSYQTTKFLSGKQRYWESMTSNDVAAIRKANEKLLDHAVGTINNLYYDHSGGNNFFQGDFYKRWKDVKKSAYKDEGEKVKVADGSSFSFDTREGALKAMRYLVGSLNDPYSKYLTREDLEKEVNRADEGFLGTGLYVEVSVEKDRKQLLGKKGTTKVMGSKSSLLSVTRAENLPVVSAVAPHSPGERVGMLVGDRIVQIGDVSFLGCTRKDVQFLLNRFIPHSDATEYFGYTPTLTIASPVLDNSAGGIIGYRLSKLRIPTSAMQPYTPYTPVAYKSSTNENTFSGGDSICNWQLLAPQNSIFEKGSEYTIDQPIESGVGYIRLTRFSRTGTSRFIDAVSKLEALGARSYIVDVRNNYGGVLQEAMLTATSMIRDPKTPLCYTLNNRGAFTPHDAEEYIIDKRYPGYILSKEPRWAVLEEAKSKNPSFFSGDGEQGVKRGLKMPQNSMQYQEQSRARSMQKSLVIIMNEGTASSAEVFVSSLRDNGRALALVGSKTYGKGLIQHTFPMPDGGGLRLTVAEYLTPSLQHVTNVGVAQYDEKGNFIGGGIQPDVYCDTKGIPNNPGADLCVDKALDVLNQGQSFVYKPPQKVIRLNDNEYL